LSYFFSWVPYSRKNCVETLFGCCHLGDSEDTHTDKDRHTDTDRQTDRQTGRQTDRQTDTFKSCYRRIPIHTDQTHTRIYAYVSLHKLMRPHKYAHTHLHTHTHTDTLAPQIFLARARTLSLTRCRSQQSLSRTLNTREHMQWCSLDLSN